MDPVPAFMQPPGPADSGVAEWRAHTGTIVGGAERLAGRLLPFPHPASDPGTVNRFVVEATRGHDGVRAALLATPRCSPDAVEALAEPQIGGFKVYWCYAAGPGDPRQALPSRFLPEWVWQQAHERGWFITLHLMRDAALADAGNRREVRDHCERYPNAKLILAHAAQTLYNRLMLQHGFLAADGMFVSLPHTEAVIDEYETAMDHVFAEIAAALHAGDGALA